MCELGQGRHMHLRTTSSFFFLCVSLKNWEWPGDEAVYNRANLPQSLTPIVRFTLELERFVHDCTAPTKNEKLQSNGVAICTHITFPYTVCMCTGN